MKKMNSNSVLYLPSAVPLPIPESELLELISKGKDWAITHGASIRSKLNPSEDSINFAPFVLFPSTIQRKEFYHATDIQAAFQELIHKVANDRDFLTKSLMHTILVDDFTRKLWEIYITIQGEGETQPISLGLLRCDYMMDPCDGEKHKERQNKNSFPPCSWKLIEINTIACGFGWLGPASGLIHRFILQEMNLHDKLVNLPENNALDGLCEGILEAWKMYGNPDSCIVIIVEDFALNISDQRFHQFKLRELNPNVIVTRKTLSQIYQEAYLNDQKELVLGDQIVGLVYYRSAYEPANFHGETEWTARLLIERSKAVKCPNIQYHLAGTKKVQQELAKPGVLEKFMDDKDSIKSIRDAFVGIYGLDFDENGEDAVQLALEKPEKYVLKPQREGGGNNIYGSDVKDIMNKMKDSKERTAWILMERIFPPITKGYMVRPGGNVPPPISEMVSEFGVFGIIIGNAKQIISNRQVGHILRTKIATEDEGGVSAGLGALDSPYLVD